MIPGFVARRLGPARTALFAEFIRFGVVGVAGLVVDTLVLYAMLGLGAGLYGGRIISYIAAASTTYALNRAWTFRARAGQAPIARQWALFLAVNLVGFAMNYGTYVALVSFWPLAAAHPVIAVAAGAIAGMGGNFILSRRLVFRAA
ncbi:GtrA family protein [Acetobacteraceae bacterium H6797]|nr:GtrA family protein [Acetobacteraceae bacterium H6797]